MNAEPDKSKAGKTWLKLLLFGVLFAGALTAGWCRYRPDIKGMLAEISGNDAGAGNQMDKYFTVKRGGFNITVLVDGNLNAIKRHDLRCEAKGRFELRITEVIEDKSKVKKGDILIKFDKEKAQETLDKLRIDLDNLERDLALAQEDMEMRKSENRSSLKNAYDKLRSANEALQKYKDIDAPKQRRNKQSAINSAHDTLKDAEKKLSAARNELASLESMEQSKIEELEDKVKQAEKNLVKAQQGLDDANQAFRIFRQYDFPQKMRGLQEAVVQARLNLRKAFVNAKGKIIQAERRIQNYIKQIKSKKEQIKRMEDDISKLEIRAPVDGIVTLGNPRRRHWQEPKEIKVGSKVYSRQILASIPDLSKFEVSAQIPEEYRSRVHVGLEAKLRSPAFPDLVMEGKIASIAPMATHTVRWDKSSPKIYDTKINTDTTDPRLMPGMTVKIEIIVETVKNVLFVPVEAAFNREGKTYCLVRALTGSQEREIETGRSSIHYVEITRGLEEGEEVLLRHNLGDK